MNVETPSWKTTMNGSLKHRRWISEACAGATEAGYEFFTWNGWVYSSGMNLRIMLEEELNHETNLTQSRADSPA